MRPRSSILWVLTIVLALFGLFAASGIAQVATGRITGLVTDQTGAVIPGATVTLVNVNTGIRTVQQAQATGSYLFDLLTPGTYSITVEASGFTKFIQENIRVQASSDVTVNAAMRPGAVTQTVTVTAAPTGLQLNTSNKNIN
ncbi:MAG: carboxypeptidase-like regulatory domain-containing protein, partial [Terriglobia bacterium]